MMRARTQAVALLLLLLAGCSGCRRGASRSTIAVIPRDTAEEIWVSEHGGADDAAYKRNLSIYWNGPSSDGDVEQQILSTEHAINADDYGIILSPSNSFAFNTVIHRAIDHKIPVVIVGAPLPMPPQPGLSFVLNDANKMGYLAAERVHRLLGNHGQVIVVGIDDLTPGSVERSTAFEQALHELAPGITIVRKLHGPLSYGQSELASEEAINAYPKVSVIFALNISATSGASAAVQNTGMAHKIRIIGCDQTHDQIFMLRHGVIDSIVAEDMRTMGYLAVEQIDDQRHGRPVPPRTLVEPVLVTRENVDSERVQRILSERWRPEK